jgi:hypothetical protein
VLGGQRDPGLLRRGHLLFELKRRQDAATALGSNLCGAVVGGLLENLSMVVGLKAIALLC